MCWSLFKKPLKIAISHTHSSSNLIPFLSRASCCWGTYLSRASRISTCQCSDSTMKTTCSIYQDPPPFQRLPPVVNPHPPGPHGCDAPECWKNITYLHRHQKKPSKSLLSLSEYIAIVCINIHLWQNETASTLPSCNPGKLSAMRRVGRWGRDFLWSHLTETKFCSSCLARSSTARWRNKPQNGMKLSAVLHKITQKNQKSFFRPYLYPHYLHFKFV